MSIPQSQVIPASYIGQSYNSLYNNILNLPGLQQIGIFWFCNSGTFPCTGQIITDGILNFNDGSFATFTTNNYNPNYGTQIWGSWYTVNNGQLQFNVTCQTRAVPNQQQSNSQLPTQPSVYICNGASINWNTGTINNGPNANIQPMTTTPTTITSITRYNAGGAQILMSFQSHTLPSTYIPVNPSNNSIFPYIDPSLPPHLFYDPNLPNNDSIFPYIDPSHA